MSIKQNKWNFETNFVIGKSLVLKERMKKEWKKESLRISPIPWGGRQLGRAAFLSQRPFRILSAHSKPIWYHICSQIIKLWSA